VTPHVDDPAIGTEKAISGILRTGVAASLVLLVSGSVLSFAQAGGYGAQASAVPHLSGAEGAFPRTARWLFSGLKHGNGQAVIVLGLLLLIATPVLRVAVSVLAFARERDRMYTIITALVLLLLLLSFELGMAG
jgi:uncharacterized membrane protein